MKADTVREAKRPVRSFRLDREGKSDLWLLFSVIAFGVMIHGPLGLTDGQIDILIWCLLAAGLALTLVPRVWKSVRRQ